MHYQAARYNAVLEKMYDLQIGFEADIERAIKVRNQYQSEGKNTIGITIQINNNITRYEQIDQFIQTTAEFARAMQEELQLQKNKFNEYQNNNRTASNHCRACDRWFN